MGVLYTIVGIGLVLGVMVLIHEWGHFIVARMCGVRVDVCFHRLEFRSAALWLGRKGQRTVSSERAAAGRISANGRARSFRSRFGR